MKSAWTIILLVTAFGMACGHAQKTDLKTAWTFTVPVEYVPNLSQFFVTDSGNFELRRGFDEFLALVSDQQPSTELTEYRFIRPKDEMSLFDFIEKTQGDVFDLSEGLGRQEAVQRLRAAAWLISQQKPWKKGRIKQDVFYNFGFFLLPNGHIVRLLTYYYADPGSWYISISRGGAQIAGNNSFYLTAPPFGVHSSVKKRMEGTVGINPGQIAPNIRLPNPSGDTLSLSSLRRKIVMIDFWASWCGPCRMISPDVRNIYAKYKNEKLKTAPDGFDIFSISLDNSVSRWRAAIEKDSLSWTSHVSDLGGWESVPAKQFSVDMLPAAYIIDGNGVIIWHGYPMAKYLEKFLEKLKQ